VADDGYMPPRYIDGLTIRMLRNGDTGTVAALFDRLRCRPREKGSCGAKPRLSENELTALARVDGEHHVLVGYLAGDPQPAGIARLVRNGATAEVAFEVADAYQGRGIGSILARELAADARAAGIRELVVTVWGDNPPAVSLLKLVGTSLHVHWRGQEREFVVGLET
jgi:ribosomal protein S18 acetylase RimI-like enzyme